MRVIAVLLSLFCAYPAIGVPLCCSSDVVSGCCTPVPEPPPCCCCDDAVLPVAPVETPPACPCEWDQAAADHYIGPVAPADLGAPMVLDLAARDVVVRVPVMPMRNAVREAPPPEPSPPLSLLCRFRL